MQLVRQMVYTMFITNNHASFHLVLKENLVKHQKVSKYYNRNCSSLSVVTLVNLGESGRAGRGGGAGGETASPGIFCFITF